MRTQDYPIDRSIGFLLGRTFRRWRPIMEQQISSAGISHGMWFFLRALWEKDGVSQREIAEMVGLTQPTAWAALRKLEAQKMVDLQPDSEDKRKVLVFLTDKGRSLEEVLLPRVEHINEVALGGHQQNGPGHLPPRAGPDRSQHRVRRMMPPRAGALRWR